MEVDMEAFTLSFPLVIHMRNLPSMLRQKARAQIHLGSRSHTTWPLTIIRFLFFSSSIPYINSSQIIQSTPTPISSLESGWSNSQGDKRFVPVESYRSSTSTIRRNASRVCQPLEERVRLEAKNSVLKYVSHVIELCSMTYLFLILEKRTNISLNASLLPWVNVLRPNVKPTQTLPTGFSARVLFCTGRRQDHLCRQCPCQGFGCRRDDADDIEDDANGDDDGALVEQTNGVSKAKRGKGRASQGQNVKNAVYSTRER